ncbi:MAG: hypothetical protein Q7S72_01945 [Candidatus Taylorbacteria bacterium]|nr:hypothetical protein [Candidatus Taylorbacteria bacterium]
MTKQISIAWFLLRFGVAFTFLYASISAFIDPAPWLGYFPDFMRAWDIDNILLLTWGGGELIIGLWLLSGYRIFLPSIASAGLMLGIFLTDFDSLHIIFRNVCILCTSISLAIISNPHYDFHLRYEKTRAVETHTELV